MRLAVLLHESSGFLRIAVSEQESSLLERTQQAANTDGGVLKKAVLQLRY